MLINYLYSVKKLKYEINANWLMNKIILKVLIFILITFLCFIVYLGSTDFMINPKLINKEFIIEDD